MPLKYQEGPEKKYEEMQFIPEKKVLATYTPKTYKKKEPTIFSIPLEYKHLVIEWAKTYLSCYESKQDKKKQGKTTREVGYAKKLLAILEKD